MSSRNQMLVTVVAEILVVMLVWYTAVYLGQKGVVSQRLQVAFTELMGRSPVEFCGPHLGRFLSGVFQDSLEEAARDQFPFFTSLVPFCHAVARQSQLAALVVLPAYETPLTPASPSVLLLESEQRLVQVPEVGRAHDQRLQRERAEYYRQL